MKIVGSACLGSFGNGPNALQDALQAAQQAAQQATPAQPLRPEYSDGRAKQADLTDLDAFFPKRMLRQTDHYTQMALLCAALALCDAGVDLASIRGTADLGIVLTSGYGPAMPTFDFLDSILTYGEKLSSPLAFSRSVHNIPAASIAMAFDLHGPCVSICQLEGPVTAGVLLAQSWLQQGAAQRVLLLAVDEHTPLLAALSAELARENQLRQKTPPRSVKTGALPLSEGAAAFLLAPDTPGQAEARVTYGAAAAPTADLSADMTQENGTMLFVSGHVPIALTRFPAVTHAASAYGNIAIAQAFDVLLALAACRAQAITQAPCLAFSPYGNYARIDVRKA